MAPWVFFVIVAFFTVGIVWGFIIGRSKNAVQRRSQAMESELIELREQLSEYKQQVGQHFAQTADVVNAMTANYRALYDHLIKGAQALCGDQLTRAKLDPSAVRFIEHRRDDTAAESAPSTSAEHVTRTEPPQSAVQPPRDASGPSHIADAMDKSLHGTQAHSGAAGEVRQDPHGESAPRPNGELKQGLDLEAAAEPEAAMNAGSLAGDGEQTPPEVEDVKADDDETTVGAGASDLKATHGRSPTLH